MTDPRAPIFAAVRAALLASRGRGLATAEVRAGDAWLDTLGIPRAGDVAAPAEPPREPAWIAEARRLLGTREIPGARHNPVILGFWQRLRVTWFKDDETPWCGAFVGHCIAHAGLAPPPPAEVGRAAAWASWGVPCRPQLGAIGVKRRTGGNHVFFIVGETPDKRFYKALGGNQSNAVTIMDIAKADTFALRWPAGADMPGIALPVLPAGTVSRNEA